MAIISRIQPQAGESVPVDTISGNTLIPSAGSATLEEISGEYGWRLGLTDTNFDANLASPHTVNTNTAGAGATLSIRYRINTYGNDSDGVMAGMLTSSGDSFTYRKTGTSDLRFRMGALVLVVTAFDSRYDQTGLINTVVAKIEAASGSDFIYGFYEQDIPPGDTPDQTDTGNMVTSTFDRVRINNMDNSDLTILDVVIEDVPLTDAQCRSIANDIRAFYPVSSPVGPSIISQPSDQTPEVDQPFTYDLSSLIDNTNSTLPVVYSINGTLNSGLSLVGSSITGTPDSEDVQTISFTVTDDDLNSVTSQNFTITVDATAWGVTPAEITAADETGGVSPPFLINDIDGSDLSTDRFSYTIDVQPSAGVLVTDKYSRALLYNAPDGNYTATYTGYKNKVPYGSATLTFQIGETQSTLNMTSTNVPDGVYNVDFYNATTKAHIITDDITFSNGNSSYLLSVDVGTRVFMFEDSATPLTSGICYVGDTE